MWRIRDVYPGTRILIFTHPGCRIQKQQWQTLVKKNLLSYLFFGVINFKKLNYFIFEMLKEKIWANFPKIWVWDPGSGKNLFRIPDPGVKKTPDPGSGSATQLATWEQEAEFLLLVRRIKPSQAILQLWITTQKCDHVSCVSWQVWN